MGATTDRETGQGSWTALAWADGRDRLDGQLELAALLDDARDVEVEEVGVEHRLHDARDDDDRVEEGLRVVAVAPVQDVER